MPTSNAPIDSRVGADDQRHIARLAQDAFVRCFRTTLEGDEESRQREAAEAGRALLDWCAEGDAPARAALVLHGLDQWGIAFQRAFGDSAVIGLKELLAMLQAAIAHRGQNDDTSHTLNTLTHQEDAAFPFKAELHAGIILALWHTMIAEDDPAAAESLLKLIAGTLLGLVEALPNHGWRLAAGALADIQLRCLSHDLAREGPARDHTEALFAALNEQFPEDQRGRIMQHATEAVLAWQQSRRSAH